MCVSTLLKHSVDLQGTRRFLVAQKLLFREQIFAHDAENLLRLAAQIQPLPQFPAESSSKAL